MDRAMILVNAVCAFNQSNRIGPTDEAGRSAYTYEEFQALTRHIWSVLIAFKVPRDERVLNLEIEHTENWIDDDRFLLIRYTFHQR